MLRIRVDGEKGRKSASNVYIYFSGAPFPGSVGIREVAGYGAPCTEQKVGDCKDLKGSTAKRQVTDRVGRGGKHSSACQPAIIPYTP